MNPICHDFRIFSSELLWWEIAMYVAADGVSQVTLNYIKFTVSTTYISQSQDTSQDEKQLLETHEL